MPIIEYTPRDHLVCDMTLSAHFKSNLTFSNEVVVCRFPPTKSFKKIDKEIASKLIDQLRKEELEEEATAICLVAGGPERQCKKMTGHLITSRHGAKTFFPSEEDRERSNVPTKSMYINKYKSFSQVFFFFPISSWIFSSYLTVSLFLPIYHLIFDRILWFT